MIINFVLTNYVYQKKKKFSKSTYVVYIKNFRFLKLRTRVIDKFLIEKLTKRGVKCQFLKVKCENIIYV